MISDELRAKLDQPLDPKTMDDDGCIRLIAAFMSLIKRDYIIGKLALLRSFGRVPDEKEFHQLSHKGYIDYISRVGERYYSARRSVLNDPYGFGHVVSPEDILSEWDREVSKHYAKGTRSEGYI